MLVKLAKKLKKRILNTSKDYREENQKAIAGFSYSFQVEEFRFLDASDTCDLKWGWWSRIYEYPWVINSLKRRGFSSDSIIHNTCWGYEGSHILFKNLLETECKNVTNSDINPSPINNTLVWDITRKSPEDWVSKFDFVLNVSTLEEVDAPQIISLENSISMVKPGGYFIATFDFPGMQLDMFELLFQQKIIKPLNPVTGASSPWRMDQYANLSCGALIIKRI